MRNECGSIEKDSGENVPGFCPNGSGVIRAQSHYVPPPFALFPNTLRTLQTP